MLEPLGFEVFDAPEHSPPPHPSSVSINYAANLARNGYWQVDTVTQRLTGWRTLLDRLKPELLVADHAPAALLACRNIPIAKVAIGNGFTLPPLRSPMPSLQPWFPIAESRLMEEERRFLAGVNPALHEMGISTLASVASLFDGAERLLCIEPELDHYPVRPDETYLGAVEQVSELPPPPIDRDTAPVFVYLSVHNRFLPALLAALRARRIPALAYIAGGEELADAEPTGSTIRHLSGLVDLKEVARHCRLAVIHGGTLTASLFLKRGVKLLICPQDLEKALLGWRLAERGLAWSLNWFSPDDTQPETRLDEILNGPLPPRLAGFAARHADLRADENVAIIAGRLAEMARSGGVHGRHLRAVR